MFAMARSPCNRLNARCFLLLMLGRMIDRVFQLTDRSFADAMLGRLARWLRMLGYDTDYDKVIAENR
ncbi:MAG: hypothetical protein EHM80_16130 [Nitrospiraceae bacterium]|nr:MAG: hypothetical protein EHM80_16130 [Nitrospiraceae bacterium]